MADQNLDQDQAYKAMREGKKITHKDFTSDEFFHIQNGKILGEDGVNFSQAFWTTPIYAGKHWRIKE